MPDQPSDTIAAIATPPGRGGIGIVRLSGPDALAIATPLLRLTTPLKPNRARFCELIDPAEPAVKLDEAVVTYFRRPRSYTGEDVVEIAAHGSPVLLDFLLRQTVANGARLANPGEYTERAFLAGRLDLTQAEAVRDLIEAQTLYQARVAASQLDGALSRCAAPIKAALIHLIAQLEAGIDFAEDDTPTLTPSDFLTLAAPIAEQLAAFAHTFEHGRLVHAGFKLAIVGEPNVGKSSLFNRLVEHERAIVTSTPGTTRDLVTERISFAGIPVELVDTAGLRDAAPSGPLEEAERLGIAKSRETLAEADLVLLVVDAAALKVFEEDAIGDAGAPSLQLAQTTALLEKLEGRRFVLVLNKCDLLTPTIPGSDVVAAAHRIDEPTPGDSPEVLAAAKLQQRLSHALRGESQAAIVATSAHTGAGLFALRRTIEQQLQTPGRSEQAGMLTNLRQHQAVEAAHVALVSALAAAAAKIPDEMLLLDLYTALRHLDALTGETTPDDILNLIFSTFCIGK